MASIINSGNFIKVIHDDGTITALNKDDIKYSVKGNNLFLNDNSGSYILLPYAAITAPTSSDIYDLRNQITAMIT